MVNYLKKEFSGIALRFITSLCEKRNKLATKPTGLKQRCRQLTKWVFVSKLTGSGLEILSKFFLPSSEFVDVHTCAWHNQYSQLFKEITPMLLNPFPFNDCIYFNAFRGYLGPYRTSLMELFSIKTFIIDIWKIRKYSSTIFCRIFSRMLEKIEWSRSTDTM